MNCPKCGTPNLDSATFCTACGASLQSPNTAPFGSQFGTSPGASASFTIGNAFGNAIALVTNPATFMRNNKDDALSVKTIIVNYVAILALIPLVATFIGDLWYYSVYGLAGYVLISAILTYILDIMAVFAIGFIIWKLGPSFGTQTTQEKSTLLAAFLYTPVFLLSILNIIPFIGIISILGLIYGLYILYLGLPTIFNTPQDKVITYLIARCCEENLRGLAPNECRDP